MEGGNLEQNKINPEKHKNFFEFLKKVGYKRPAKNPLVAIVCVLIIFTTFLFLQKSGWRMDFFAEKIKYQKYDHIGPDFSFQYPDHYVSDNNENNKFGPDYISGFRLATDQRTGCDVRSSSTGINFNKSDAEIKNALSQELSKSAKDFKLLEAKRIKIGGEPAFDVEFSFTDPINSTVRLTQNIVSHNGRSYVIVCGTGAYQYKFFQKDFNDFLQTFRWKAV